ncbi:MAG: PAS domain S-box protein [Halanaeroarchaeum sp.]
MLLEAQVVAFLATALLLGSFVLANRRYPTAFGWYWVAGWSFYVVRFALDIVVTVTGRTYLLTVAAHEAVATSAILLLLAVVQLSGSVREYYREAAFGWLGLSAWVVGVPLFTESFLAVHGPLFFAFGIIQLLTAYLFYRYLAEYDYVSTPMIVGSMAVWGLHKLDYPFLRPVEWFALYGYALGAVLAFLTGLGVMMFLLEEAERKSSERAEESRRFRQAVESSGHAIMMTDPDGTITYVNPAFEDVTGYDSAEAIGENPRILRSDEMPEEHFAALWETVLAGDVWEEEEVVNRRKDGELYHARQTIAPITGETGAQVGFVAIQNDITEQKEMEADLQERNRQLTILSRVLQHNLHNHVNVIQGNADLLRDEVDGDLASVASRIIEESATLLETGDKQGEITKLLADPPTSTEIDLSRTIDEYVDSVAGEYPDADISVSVPDSLTVRATTDLGRAVEELLDNAIEHSDRPTPSVNVRVAVDEESATINIEDDGPGIPEMERKVVTGEKAIEPLYHGSGLGLWLVDVIVSQSGGSLSFEENDPRGSTVSITLDRA